MKISRGKLLSLQALRALAASLVVLAHAQDMAEKYSRNAAESIFSGFHAVGDAGVDIFFVLSGFIMVYTALPDAGSAANAKNFLKRRAWRILPLYWLFTAVVMLMLLAMPSFFTTLRPDNWHIASSFLLIPSYNTSMQVAPLVFVGWTLSYELFFYLVFALLMLLPPKLLLPALTSLFGSLVIVGLMYRPVHPVLHLLTDPLLLEFLAGCWVAYILMRTPRFFPVATGVAALWFAVVIAHPEWFSQYHRIILWGIPATLLVAGLAASEFSDKLHTPKWLVSLGDGSYSLYLSHALVLPVIGKLWMLSGLDAHLDVNVLIIASYLCAVAAGQLTYHCIERRLTAFSGRR